VTSENTEFDLYNFAYKAGALHEKDMLAAAGEGGENFTFSFAYHGQLPGMATFAVTTDLAEGAQVNVYKFDVVTGGFTLIAKNLTVGSGGVATYRNDTMSEYLVTTETIPGAAVAAVAGQQGSIGGNIRLFIGIGLAALLCGVAVWIVLRRRKRASKPQ